MAQWISATDFGSVGPGFDPQHAHHLLSFVHRDPQHAHHLLSFVHRDPTRTRHDRHGQRSRRQPGDEERTRKGRHRLETPQQGELHQSMGAVAEPPGRALNPHRIMYTLAPGTDQETAYRLSQDASLFVVDDATHGGAPLFDWLLGAPHDRRIGGMVDHVAQEYAWGYGDDAQPGAYRWRPNLLTSGDTELKGTLPVKHVESKPMTRLTPLPPVYYPPRGVESPSMRGRMWSRDPRGARVYIAPSTCGPCM